jgi:geranylgeranyl diphosphate synthase, type III
MEGNEDYRKREETRLPPHSNNNNNNSNNEHHEPDKSLLEPFLYINSVPGKDVRGMLIDCFQYWFRVEEEEAEGGNPKNGTKVLDKIKDIVGDLHNASLLIDDIEDNSKLRRGIPVAHAIFGVPAVINCANYVYFLALEKCQKLNNPVAMRVFGSELLNLHRGQGYDILWRDMVRCPTEAEYLAMVQDKTGGLFRLAVGLLQAFATRHQSDDFTKLVNDLAMYFQIRDDFINLADEEYMKSKSFCEDISEGKFSFSIVHAIQHNTSQSSAQLLSILKQRTDDDDVKKYALNLLKNLGSLEYSRQKCTALKAEIETEVAKFGGNPALLTLIDRLHVQLESIDTTSTAEDKGNARIDEP